MAKWRLKLGIALLTCLVFLSSHIVQGVDQDNTYFDQLSNDKAVIVSPDYIGTHIHHLILRDFEKSKGIPTVWPDVNIGYLRLWDSVTRWADIAPVAGQWNFDRLDAYVAAANEHHVKILYTLGSTPRWVSSRPDEACSYGQGCAAEPVKMAHWQEYVKRIATRYRGKIEVYELWNEPKFSDFEADRGKFNFYTGSAENMVEMAKIARKVLDDVDPDAKLLSPGFVNGPHRLDKFLEKGGGQYIQGIAYHFYTSDAPKLVEQIQAVKTVMQKYGVDNLPLWNTESGVEVWSKPTPPGVNPNETDLSASARMLQYFIIGAEMGLAHSIYYSWDNEHSGVVNWQGQINSNRLNAFKRAAEWLPGTKMLGCNQPMGLDKMFVCYGEKDQTRFIYAWSERSKNFQYKPPKGWVVSNVEKLNDIAKTQVSEAGIPISIFPTKITLVQKLQ